MPFLDRTVYSMVNLEGCKRIQLVALLWKPRSFISTCKVLWYFLNCLAKPMMQIILSRWQLFPPAMARATPSPFTSLAPSTATSTRLPGGRIAQRYINLKKTVNCYLRLYITFIFNWARHSLIKLSRLTCSIQFYFLGDRFSIFCSVWPILFLWKTFPFCTWGSFDVIAFEAAP